MHGFTKAQNSGLYVQYLRRFRGAKILKHYGLNFAQFMSLPQDIAAMMLRDADDANREEAKAIDRAREAIGDDL